jgi:glycosyltransferase involved in cell wall biosynthesis
MSELAKTHEVSIVSLVLASEDQTARIAKAKTYCQRVEVVADEWHRMQGRAKRVFQLASLLSPWSWEKVLYLRPAFQRALDLHLRQHDYDAVVCEFVFMANFRFPRASAQRRPRLVLDEHNVEYDLLRRTAEATATGRRVFQELNWRKLKREEVGIWRQFDACAVTSARDEEIVRCEAPSLRTAVVPNGVDIDEFVPVSDTKVEAKTLLFFGAINYFPNTDGALYFAREMLPSLRAQDPSIQLRIVGPVGEGPVMDLRSQGVQVLGFVDDVKTEIEKATVVIVPLRIGGGTRLKILEAMAMGKTIVSTSLGAEGLEVEHGKDILIADTPEEFVQQVSVALNSPELRERLGKEARKSAVALYSWPSAAKKMESLLLSLGTPD